MNEIWEKILLIGGISIGGTTLGAIVIAIIWRVLTSAFNKLIRKINVDNVVEVAVERAIGRIKKLAFTHDIQPIVLSEVKKMGEEIKADVEKEFTEIKENQRKQVVIAEKQASYFEDSIVSDDKKKALKDAIADAKQDSVVVESVVVEETIKAEEKTIVAPVEAVKTQAKVER